MEVAAAACGAGRRCGEGRGGMSYAAKSGSAEAVRMAARLCGPDFEGDARGSTPLHLLLDGGGTLSKRVAGARPLEALAELVGMGHPLSPRNKEGLEPLASAIRGGESEGRDALVFELLRLGADPQALCRRGLAPLHMACIHGAPEVARELAKLVDPKPRTRLGAMPLHFAADLGHLECMALFIDAEGCEAVDAKGRGPLHMAAKSSRHEAVAELAKWGWVDRRAHDGDTPLMAAARHARPHPYREGPRRGDSKFGCGRALLAAGADPDLVDAMGRNAFMIACAGGVEELAMELAKVSPLGRVDLRGRTALGCAEESGRGELMRRVGELMSKEAALDIARHVPAARPLAGAARKARI